MPPYARVCTYVCTVVFLVDWFGMFNKRCHEKKRPAAAPGTHVVQTVNARLTSWRYTNGKSPPVFWRYPHHPIDSLTGVVGDSCDRTDKAGNVSLGEQRERAHLGEESSGIGGNKSLHVVCLRRPRKKRKSWKR